jgi:hypothetical protein
MRLLTALWLATGALAAQRNVTYIVPGGAWTDTSGAFISAHAGAIVHNPVDGQFYWFGQDVVGDNSVFQGVNVYKSPDLGQWTRVGHALSPVNGTALGPDRVVERPKVVWNEPTKSWVVWPPSVAHCNRDLR